MTTYLDRILVAHRAAAAVDERSVDSLVSRLPSAPPIRGFEAALAALPDGELGVIAEVKRRSPSKGDLAVGLDPSDLAQRYQSGGATCLSVLTDGEFFGGSADDLRAARSATRLPVLRKDFTVSPHDVLDARLMGADAVLLIAAALDDSELSDLHALARELGLGVLVEVHDEAELERAMKVGATMVGVNQRDLVTFEVDTERAVRMAPLMPDGVLRVAESGVSGPDDAARLAEAGYHAVLVGESLVTAGDPSAAVTALRSAHLKNAPRRTSMSESTQSDEPDGAAAAADGRHPIFALSDRFVDDFADLSPTTATFLGLGTAEDRWDDFTPEGYDAQAELLRDYQGRLAELPPATDQWDRLAVRILHEHLALSLEPLDHGDHLRELGHLQSLFPQLRETFDLMGSSTAADWRNIAARLASLGEALEGLRACLEAGRTKGLLAPKRQTRSIIEQLRASVADQGAFSRLVGRFDEHDIDDAELRQELREALALASDSVEEMAQWLETDYLPDATEADAAGEERYRRAARSFLGTDLDLHDTYRWGWDHLYELRAEMEELAEAIDPGQGLHKVVKTLAEDPSRAAATQEEFRTRMLDRLRQAMVDLDGEHFDIPEEIKPCDVRLAPMGAPLGAYFVPPSEDFTRPGTTWWSIGEQEPVPLWDQVTTAYHEGFPGHHLQCGMQVWLSEHLSRVHRLLFWLPGYGEGWALYAERLMRELGYFEKPEYELGLLAANALRAVRIVIDIGSHLELPIPDDVDFHPGERWTFDLAVEALEHFAFLPHADAVSEVTRYLGWPGQAIAYKVGERVILGLREELRQRDGDQFDLKAFHARVLGAGALGLDHLRELALGQPPPG